MAIYNAWAQMASEPKNYTILLMIDLTYNTQGTKKRPSFKITYKIIFFQVNTVV